jgi:integrase
MSSSKRDARARRRIGKVSIYLHHAAWWIYYRDAGKQVRRKVAQTRLEAEQIAAQVNAQLASGAPTLLAFTPISIPDLRQNFLAFHEHVLKSSIATISRYRAATNHLEVFIQRRANAVQAHEIRAEEFVGHLRRIEIAPNGHPNAARRRLRDKGIRFILETCRAMYTFAGKRRHLPPYVANPFAELPLEKLRNDDAKPIFVFDADLELAFLKAANAWCFQVHFTLAKTGLRIGELVHLLIEELDLENGWLYVRNKTTLGWRVKTGSERAVPLLPEVVTVLRKVIACRVCGPVFLRARFTSKSVEPMISGDRQRLESICEERQREAGNGLSRAEILRIARTVWRDAGAVKADAIRTSFIRTTRLIGHAEATCPKSWRHSFATLLQDANVDPLIRQITLGHTPTVRTGLGMTANYTHTRPSTQRQQIEEALRRWPRSLELARLFIEGINFFESNSQPTQHMEVLP